MHRVPFFPLFVVWAFAVIIVPNAALAQDTTVSAGGLFEAIKPYLVEIMAALVSLLIGWVVAKISKLTGLNIEARHREALQSALTNGVNYGIEKMGRSAAGMTLDVKNVLIADGIRYVQNSVPDAIRHFGLTPERIRQLLEAKLGAALNA